jgi:hypothetical protein
MDGRMKTTYTERGFKFEVGATEVNITSFKAGKKISIPLVDGQIPHSALQTAMRELRAAEIVIKSFREVSKITTLTPEAKE